MVQILNTQLINNLRAIFQPRGEPNFAWGHASSMVQALTGLRGHWPMSAIGTGGEARDLGCGNTGYDLTNNNTATYSYDALAPYVEFDGSTQYLSYVDHANFDILGTESYVAVPGLTIGGWFYFDDETIVTDEYLMAKWTSTPNRSYRLIRNTDEEIEFSVGDTVVTIASTETTTDGKWYFCAGRFTPSTEIAVWVQDTNGVLQQEVNVAAIPAAITNGNAPFTIGASGVPDSYLDGRASMCWLCAAALGDATVWALYQQQKAMYGIR